MNDLGATTYNSNNLMSANEVWGTYTIQYFTARTFESGIVDLNPLVLYMRRIYNVYISSANLSTSQTLGPRGETNII